MQPARGRQLPGAGVSASETGCPVAPAGSAASEAAVQPDAAAEAAGLPLAYHARTAHTLARYAAGPETLDWDMQPDPFRVFAGSARTVLPLGALPATGFADLSGSNAPAPAAVTRASVGQLLELALAVSAWKELGPDRWAVRCNPSSGNLHPTEAYVLAAGVAGLADGVHHYLSRDHDLEQRCAAVLPDSTEAGLWVGLSSIHWREAWKYGERAFRYCQLDLGHALGALRYAAACLGWSARVVGGLDGAALAALMGLDRAGDFAGVEREDAEALVAIGPPDTVSRAPPQGLAAGVWTGHANRLDAHPLYRWPIIADVSCATAPTGAVPEPAPPGVYPPRAASPAVLAADVLRGRRSAQRFDSRFVLPQADFFRLLDALLPRDGAPWDLWPNDPRVHLVLFVHRVEGLEPGLYALPRHPRALAGLRAALRADFAWAPVPGAPEHLPLLRLVEAETRGVARTLNCHQAIAGDSCFALSLLAEFAPIVGPQPWRYRHLHWEAGLLGHVLYLEAEAMGLRGTGIGCFFDPAVHQLLGLATADFQALYHFTVGRPMVDDRILTLPAYPDRSPAASAVEPKS